MVDPPKRENDCGIFYTAFIETGDIHALRTKEIPPF